MKLKGISSFERHAEKFVLGFFVLIFLGVLIFQLGLVGGGRTVKVGTQELPLDRAMAGVSDLAIQRRARLESEQVAEGIPATLRDPRTEFEKVMSPASKPMTLAALGRPSIIGDSSIKAATGPSLPSGDALYATLVVPAPAAPLTTIVEGTVDPAAVLEIGDSLAKLLPAEQPYDVRALSMQAAFDMAALRASLTSPQQEGAQPLPASFWQGRIEIVDVQWFRQELSPTGEWTNETLLDPLPGRRSLRELATKSDFLPVDYRDLIETERVARAEIRRPDFYPMITGRPWTWPAQAIQEAAAVGDSEVNDLRRQLTNVRQEMEDVKRRLERLPGSSDRNPTPPAPPPDGSGSGGGGGGGGGRNPGAPPPHPGDQQASSSDHSSTTDDYDNPIWPRMKSNWYAQTPPPQPPPQRPAPAAGGDRTADLRKRLQDQLARLTTRETEIVAELGKLGVDAKGAALAAQAFTEPLLPLGQTQTDTITLWSHDLTAKPGNTYRYQASIVLTNPFYGQSDRLREEQKSLADEPVIVSDPSAWSEPVTLEPETVYFITSATEAGGPLSSAARANADLFQFYYGYWRRAAVTMTPGDPLAATLQLPELATYTLQREGTGPFTVTERNALEREKTLASDIFLLDTASVIGGPSGSAQAYLRIASGNVQTRLPSTTGPDAERRARLNQSAIAGQTAVVREPGTSVPVPPNPNAPGGPGWPGDRDDPNAPGGPGAPPPPQNPNNPQLPRDRN